MVVISWVNRLSTLKIPTLKHWCDEILSMLHLAPLVTFNHIYRELNMLADDLSKKALKIEMGSGYYSKYLDGLVIGDGHFSLFWWLFSLLLYSIWLYDMFYFSFTACFWRIFSWQKCIPGMICLKDTSNWRNYWPELSGMMKKSVIEQTLIYLFCWLVGYS